MNESELKVYCLEHAGEKLPAEAEALLQRDPALRADVERLIRISKLMSLKKYEVPSEACMSRCRRGIADGIQQPASLWSRIREAFTLEQPAVAYGMAALVIGAIGVTAMMNRAESIGPVVALEETTQPLNPVLEPVIMTADVVPVTPVEETQVAAYVDPFQAFDKPLIFLHTDNTNIQPSSPRMQFGPGVTVPVSFEY